MSTHAIARLDVMAGFAAFQDIVGDPRARGM
jgi:hypothetical protein